MTCRTCENWRAPGAHEDTRFGRCELTQSLGNEPDRPATYAFVTVGDGDVGVLATDPAFHCNQWQRGELSSRPVASAHASR